MTALIVTENAPSPNEISVSGFNSAVAVLPGGRRLRQGSLVTGTYAVHNDVRGYVLGWDAEDIQVTHGSGLVELGPENILTIEEAA